MGAGSSCSNPLHQTLSGPSVALGPVPSILSSKFVFDDVHAQYAFDKEPLARGSRWTLWRVVQASTNEVYVCRSVLKSKLREKEELQHIKTEVQVHRTLSSVDQSRLRDGGPHAGPSPMQQQQQQQQGTELQVHRDVSEHPHIARCVDCFEDAAQAHIIMEECTGGDLFERIKREKALGEQAAAEVMRAVLSVVEHCHSRGIVHRGITPESFMFLTPTPHAPLKAVDFGCAAFLSDGLTDEVVGSPHYVAPEMLRGSYGPEVDEWSCGVLLYVMLCGYHPFEGSDQLEIFQQVVSAPLNLKTQPWPSISPAAKDLLCRLLVRDPKRRLTAALALQHAWFAEQQAPAEGAQQQQGQQQEHWQQQQQQQE